MQPIEPEAVQKALDGFVGRTAYLHLETTQGAYTKNTYGAFIRNAAVRLADAKLAGDKASFRVGLRLLALLPGGQAPDDAVPGGSAGAHDGPAAGNDADGWVFARGLTHWEVDDQDRLLMAGIDDEHRLTVACELSPTPFPV